MQLEPVLARWRETRDPQLAKLIVELGGEPTTLTAFEGLKPTALIAALEDELGKPDAPLASLVPIVDRVVRTARGSWPVVELFAELPADPRFAYLALELLADFGKLPHTSAKLWRRLLDAVEHHGDPSCIAPLHAVPPRDPGNPRIGNIAKRLAKATALTAAQLAELATERAEPPSKSGAELLAAIHADPSSDDARSVYADWLTSRNDPRGELIQLQLQRARGQTTPAGERRELALLKKHAKAWLGPLAALASVPDWAESYTPLPSELCVPHASLRCVTFARGFVRHLPEISAPKHRRKIYDDPIWATVEHVEAIPIITPAMRALHSIDRDVAALPSDRSFQFIGVDGDAFFALAHCPVRHLSVDLNYDRTALVLARLTDLARSNPILTEVTLKRTAPREWGELWRILGVQLARITVANDAGQLALQPTERTLTILANNRNAQEWDWVFSPLEKHAFARVVIRPGYAADVVERMARSYELAPEIIREP